MVQDSLVGNLHAKLELLRALSIKESASLTELSSELGLDEAEIKTLVDELSEVYLLRYERDKVVWLAGDNPARLRPWGWTYVYKVILGSTMSTARKSPPWTIVIAEYQYKSYGRHGKTWISDLGGVWISYKIPVTFQLAQILPMVVPTLVCSSLRDKLEAPLYIKWPNDIVYKDKKVSGILLEGEVIGGKILSTIGIGMNVNNKPPLETSTSLKLLVGALIPRNSIIARITGIMGQLERYAREPEKVQSMYLDLLDTLGRKVRAVTMSKEVVKGIAKSVTETGDLVVETDTGSRKLSSSEVYELRYEE